MKVYHGSDTLVSVIDLQKCKPNRDFGRGFYVTRLRLQAEDMAQRVTRYSKQPPIVTEFDFDEYAYEDPDLKTLRFDDYNEEWLDFVVLNRNADKRRQAHDYDIVEGPVADDRISRNISKYLNGKIAKADFLAMLKHSENHQLCFCTVNSLQMLDYIKGEKDFEYVISEIGEQLLEQLMVDFNLNDEKAADLFYSSKTFGKLADESTLLYLQPLQVIYEALKNEVR